MIATLMVRTLWAGPVNINHLIEFMYLAETLSFKRTADYFYVSRSVISRHLAALEELLGVRLVERGNQSVQLTEAGKVFYRESQTVLRTYANAVDRTRAAGRATGLVVKAGYLKNAARPVIVRFVRFMRHEHPEISLEAVCLDYSELRRSLEDGSVDVAIGVNVAPNLSRNYRATPIYEDRFIAVMGADHPLAERGDAGVAIDDLSRERLLLSDSFAYTGFNELIDGLVEARVHGASCEFYHDLDELYLRLQTEGCVTLTSGMNSAMFGGNVAIVPIVGADASFAVSAFYGDGMDDALVDACRRAFESCRAAMHDLPPTSFSLAPA